MTERFIDQVKYLREVLDAIPSLIFIVDPDLRVIDFNSTAKTYLDEGEDAVLKRLCGEVLHCLHQIDADVECGSTEFCRDCILRQAVGAVTATNSTFRDRHKLLHRKNGKEEFAEFYVTASPLAVEGEPLVLMVLQDVTELLALRYLVTLCSVCKKVRNEEGEWEAIHQYLRKKDNTVCSHGLCPSCYQEQCQELDKINEMVAAPLPDRRKSTPHA
ncbi:PAS domain-containing protein [Geomonas sp. RF6]|uniref:PAS domain-containing protein n=1 Tax=Geomonas sp. RF6 TaxID=2897342 RepID=UPI001E4C56C1|nr:PAS domain-containing protein [Geomonas sp. RF6]UFS71959.1 PAS domain-containing protein [Geomonas sp. RF6]